MIGELENWRIGELENWLSLPLSNPKKPSVFKTRGADVRIWRLVVPTLTPLNPDPKSPTPKKFYKKFQTLFSLRFGFYYAEKILAKFSI